MVPNRLFVALVPPATVDAALAELTAPLPDVRWTPRGNFHLTLRFIGDAAPDKLERFAAALGRVRVEPFILPVGGVGVFPSRGPARVLWAGAGRAHPRLFQLRQQVDEALLAVDAGLDVSGFHPHFTLGRLDPAPAPREIARFLSQHADFAGPPFRVASFQLLMPGPPPAYETVQSFPLAAAAAASPAPS